MKIAMPPQPQVLCSLLCWLLLCSATTLSAEPQALAPLDRTPAEWIPMNPGGGGWFERAAVGHDGTIVACSDLSGAYYSRDRGQSWKMAGAAEGLTDTHVSCATFDPNDAAKVLLGTDGGIFRSTSGLNSLTRTLNGGYVEALTIAPTGGGNRAYAAWHPTYDSINGRVYRSNDGGASWQALPHGAPGSLPNGLRIIKLVIDPIDQDHVYLLTGDGRFASGPARAYASSDGGMTWSDIGVPFLERVVDIAVDGTVPDKVWASVDDADPDARGHLHLSTDGGSTWTHVAQRGGFIWLDPANTQRVRMVEARYLFPWDPREGIWESTQAGLPGSWTKVSGVSTWDAGWSTAFWVYLATSIHGALAPHPLDGDTLYLVNTQFAFGTNDGGQTMTNRYTKEAQPGRWTSTGIDNIITSELVINEASPNELYASLLDLGVWRSLDGAETWTPINDATASGAWAGAGGSSWTLATDPARPGVLWAALSQDADDPQTLLFSTDAGDHWTPVGNGIPSAVLLGLSIDRTSSTLQRTLFLTAQGDVYRSVDGGVNWARVLTHGGLRVTAVDRTNGSLVYAGGEGGLWRSNSGGAPGTWHNVTHPSMTGAISGEPSWFWEGVYDIEPSPHQPGTVLVAAHGQGKGLFRSTTSGTTWEPRLLADHELRRIALDPQRPGVIYATSSSAFASGGFSTDSNGVWHSRDAGQTWRKLNRGLSWPFAHAIVVHPTNSDTVFMDSPGAGIHRLRRPVRPSRR